MRTRDEVLYAFTPQKKLDPGQIARLQKIEMNFKELATDILEFCPETPDRTVAFRKLLESKMACSQAITHVLPTKAKQNEKEAD